MNYLILMAMVLILYYLLRTLKALLRHCTEHSKALARDELRAWRQEQRRGWKVTRPEEKPTAQVYVGLDEIPKFIRNQHVN